ncbi:hypothetical protein Shyd_56850 [Streptomyces hydrogenans]|uniref:Uncharacterized protein n=1 Tax=Streptomyces hydrogenans TaxID=1873719 RepID=A0ABQ3PH23_9ACTN|nr:hypothetical protein Shyd_56850 [Streptomyces hydrogenans]
MLGLELSGAGLGILGMARSAGRWPAGRGASACASPITNRSPLPDEHASGATWRPLEATAGRVGAAGRHCPLTKTDPQPAGRPAPALLPTGAVVVSITAGVVDETRSPRPSAQVPCSQRAVDHHTHEPAVNRGTGSHRNVRC